MNRMQLFVVTAVFLWGSAAFSALAGEDSVTITKEEIATFEKIFGAGLQEEDVYRTDQLLLTATGSLKPLHKAPSVASVITKEDIEKMGATSLREVLETVPGLHVAPSSKNALDPIYSIRGIHTSVNPQTLLLMNGIPITIAWTGSRPFFRHPVANISRIEIVRGPGSAVHGADAFAGVINIITKDGQEIDGTNAGVRAGSFDTYATWVQHGGTYSGWDVAVNLEYQKSRGDRNRTLASDLQTVLDGAFGTTASLAPGVLSTDYENVNAQLSLAKGNWTVRLWRLLQDDGLADGVTQTLGQSNVDIGQFLADATYNTKELFENLDLTARVYYQYYKQDSLLQLFPPGSTLLIGNDGNINFTNPTSLAVFTDGVYGEPIQSDQQAGIELTALYEGFKQQRWRFSLGCKYLEETYKELKNFGPGVLDGLPFLPAVTLVDGALTDLTGTADIYAEDNRRRLWFLSIQDEWSIAPKWELTGGIRYDHFSDFGDTVNPRVALVWETLPQLTTKLLYGRAFRAPSFSELYAQNNPSNTGNPDLEPETIETYELAFDYQPAHSLRMVLNLFAYNINDLIELVQDPGQTTQTSRNHKDQKGHGVEVEADWEVTKTVRLKGNFSYQRSKDSVTGEIVPDAPGMQFYANAHWRFLPAWSLDGQLFWVGARHRANGDTRDDIKDNTIVNLTLRRKNIAAHWDVALAIRNLFDEDVRESSQASIPDDYPMEGRSFYGEVRLHF